MEIHNGNVVVVDQNELDTFLNKLYQNAIDYGSSHIYIIDKYFLNPSKAYSNRPNGYNIINNNGHNNVNKYENGNGKYLYEYDYSHKNVYNKPNKSKNPWIGFIEINQYEDDLVSNWINRCLNKNINIHFITAHILKDRFLCQQSLVLDLISKYCKNSFINGRANVTCHPIIEDNIHDRFIMYTGDRIERCELNDIHVDMLTCSFNGLTKQYDIPSFHLTLDDLFRFREEDTETGSAYDKIKNKIKDYFTNKFHIQY